MIVIAPKWIFMRLRKGSTNEDSGACFKIMIWVQDNSKVKIKNKIMIFI